MLAKDKEAKGAPTAAPPPALASEGGSVYAARARSTTRDVAAYIVSVITPLLFSSAPGHVISRWRSGKRCSTEPRRRLEAPEKHRHNDFGRCRCEKRQDGGAASCSSAARGLVLSTCRAEERGYAVRRCKQQHAPFVILEGMSPGMRNGDCVVLEPAV